MGAQCRHQAGSRLARSSTSSTSFSWNADAGTQLSSPRTDDLIDVREAEGDEEQPRLVDVAIVAVDDVDLGLVRVEVTSQPVRSHGAAGTAPQDDDLLLAHDAPPVTGSSRVTLV